MSLPSRLITLSSMAMTAALGIDSIQVVMEASCLGVQAYNLLPGCLCILHRQEDRRAGRNG